MFNPICGSNQYLQSGTCIDNPVCIGDQTLNHHTHQCIDPVCEDNQNLINGVCVYKAPSISFQQHHIISDDNLVPNNSMSILYKDEDGNTTSPHKKFYISFSNIDVETLSITSSESEFLDSPHYSYPGSFHLNNFIGKSTIDLFSTSNISSWFLPSIDSGLSSYFLNSEEENRYFIPLYFADNDLHYSSYPDDWSKFAGKTITLTMTATGLDGSIVTDTIEMKQPSLCQQHGGYKYCVESVTNIDSDNFVYTETDPITVGFNEYTYTNIYKDSVSVSNKVRFKDLENNEIDINKPIIRIEDVDLDTKKIKFGGKGWPGNIWPGVDKVEFFNYSLLVDRTTEKVIKRNYIENSHGTYTQYSTLCRLVPSHNFVTGIGWKNDGTYYQSIFIENIENDDDHEKRGIKIYKNGCVGDDVILLGQAYKVFPKLPNGDYDAYYMGVDEYWPGIGRDHLAKFTLGEDHKYNGFTMTVKFNYLLPSGLTSQSYPTTIEEAEEDNRFPGTIIRKFNVQYESEGLDLRTVE